MNDQANKVKQLNQTELSEINGGYWWVGVIVAIADLIEEVKENPEDVEAGYVWLDSKIKG